MRTSFLLAAASAVLLFVATPSAQAAEPQFGVFGGLAFPVGDYADDNGSDAGGAGLGFFVGGEIDVALPAKGLSWYSTLMIVRNSFDEDVFGFQAQQGQTLETDAGAWLHFPAMSGLKYESEINQDVRMFGFGQMGLNFFMPPGADFTLTAGNQTANGEGEADSGVSFGFGIGGGAVFNDQITVSARFLILGEPEVESEFSGEIFTQTINSESDVAISMFVISGGYRF